eukprot:COSAG01_NODE_8597_length_2724_cov_1.964952_4_plen_136_part_00
MRSRSTTAADEHARSAAHTRFPRGRCPQAQEAALTEKEMGEKHMADEHWEAAQAALRKIVDAPPSLARPGAGGGRPVPGASRGGDLAPAKPVVLSARRKHVDRKSGLAVIYLRLAIAIPIHMTSSRYWQVELAIQ